MIRFVCFGMIIDNLPFVLSVRYFQSIELSKVCRVVIMIMIDAVKYIR